MDYFEPRLPCDATQLGRFRAAIGEEVLEQLLKATIETAVEIKAIKPAELERVIVDSTVRIELKQTFAAEGKTLRRKAEGYAHAKQFKRLRKAV